MGCIIIAPALELLMARQSYQDLLWTQLELCLLAWEAVRLDPDYRKDWEDNKTLVDSLKSGPQYPRNDPPALHLRRLGSKWRFSPGRILEDPGRAIPFIPQSRFHKCTKRCFLLALKPSSRCPVDCLPRYLAYLDRYCPFSYAQSIAVLLACPYEPAIITGERFSRAAMAAYKFDQRERAKPHRLVLWCKREFWRKGLAAQIIYYLNKHLAETAKAGARDPRRVRRRNLVAAHWTPESLILSIDLLGSKRRIWREIDKALARLPRRPFDDILPAVKRGLEYYRMKHIEKKTLEQICISKLGKGVWARHRFLRKTGEEHPKVCAIEYALKAAERFIAKKGYRGLVR